MRVYVVCRFLKKIKSGLKQKIICTIQVHELYKRMHMHPTASGMLVIGLDWIGLRWLFQAFFQCSLSVFSVLSLFFRGVFSVFSSVFSGFFFFRSFSFSFPPTFRHHAVVVFIYRSAIIKLYSTQFDRIHGVSSLECSMHIAHVTLG